MTSSTVRRSASGRTSARARTPRSWPRSRAGAGPASPSRSASSLVGTGFARCHRYGGAAMSELSGQVAIVTGGASGIGAATVALLAGAGATVVTADVQPASKDAPGRFVRHDVAAEASWKDLLADVLSRDGRLDILVNNAGISGGWA